MATTVEIILKATDKASKAFKNAGKSAKDLNKTLEGIGKSFGVAGGAILTAGKIISEFGGQGGAVIQTAESFDLLIDRVGATPDLLDDLRDASRGTISDFELMSSTATLLAGASRELGTELANATPRLMEIAKAANKLNPALGDTAFMYNSIATGVKRAQPLILDNLGLMIKVGDANEKMAKKLGKSVEALTAEEKSMAILNATLEAGNVMIDQVGGTTESATDAFERMDASIKNASDTMKAKFAPSLAKAADAVTLLLTWSDQLQAALIEHEKAVRDSAVSYEEYVEEMERAVEVAGYYITAEGDLLSSTSKLVQENYLLTEVQRLVGDTTDDVLYSMALLGETFPIQATMNFASEMGNLSSAIDGLAGSYDFAKASAQLMSEALKIASDGVADAERKKLLLNIATKGYSEAETEAAFAELETLKHMEKLNKELDEGNITWNDYVEILDGGTITQDEMNELLGVVPEVAIPATDAMENMGLTVEEASNALKGAKTQGIQFLNILDKFHDISFTVSVFYDIGGLPVAPGAGGIPARRPGAPSRRQHGGPVAGNQAYLVGEAGPELFVPRGSGDIVPSEKVGGDTFIIHQNFHNQEVAALAYDEIWRVRDKRDNELMGV